MHTSNGNSTEFEMTQNLLHLQYRNYVASGYTQNTFRVPKVHLLDNQTIFGWLKNKPTVLSLNVHWIRACTIKVYYFRSSSLFPSLPASCYKSQDTFRIALSGESILLYFLAMLICESEISAWMPTNLLQDESHQITFTYYSVADKSILASSRFDQKSKVNNETFRGLLWHICA